MPTKVTIDGQEQELFTPEELEQQKKDVLEQFKKDNPDKSAELTKLQEDLKKATDELAGLKDKDTNFKTLREAKDALEAKVKELTAEMDNKISVAKKEVLEGVMKDHYTDLLKQLSGDDEELKKKIEFQYKRLGDAASTKDEITKKLSDAAVLATGGQSKGISSAAAGSSGASPLKVGGSGKTPLNQEEAEVLQKLAKAGGIKLDEKDIKNA